MNMINSLNPQKEMATSGFHKQESFKEANTEAVEEEEEFEDFAEGEVENTQNIDNKDNQEKEIE